MNSKRLFAVTRANLDWPEFAAKGFSALVTGVVYSVRMAPDCGVPLGVSADVRGGC